MSVFAYSPLCCFGLDIAEAGIDMLLAAPLLRDEPDADTRLYLWTYMWRLGKWTIGVHITKGGCVGVCGAAAARRRPLRRRPEGGPRLDPESRRGDASSST
eukprot:GHVU01224211.1.p2 GENE.GHVU01224211.1~~GHVU01224211.1.p2  ORF type:complete len:101 (-),score=9.01 GHVU01224211.1:342-644(-)